MSQTNIYPISCPKCGAVGDTTLFDAINVAEEPVLREQLLANELNSVRCGGCQFSYRVDKPLLYNDPNRHAMIYLIPTELDDQSDGEQQFQRLIAHISSALPPNLHPPEVHLVFSRTELVERIFLIEVGLQPRVVEYIKYSMFAQNIDTLDPNEKVLLFNAEDSTDEMLCFVVQDHESKQLESVLQYSRQAYRGLCEMFDQDDRTASLLEMFPGPYLSARTLLIRESSPL